MPDSAAKYRSTLTIRVPFFDVDPMQIVWHGHYVKYFEMARCAMLDEIGYNYEAMRESGYAWPIIDLRIRYAHPLRFNQLVDVEVTLLEWENRLRLGYRILDHETGKRLSKGETSQVAVEAATGEMQFVSPGILSERLRAVGAIGTTRAIN